MLLNVFCFVYLILRSGLSGFVLLVVWAWVFGLASRFVGFRVLWVSGSISGFLAFVVFVFLLLDSDWFGFRGCVRNVRLCGFL